MTRTTALASLFALALTAGAAHADNIVGGSSATISGGGDNLTVTYNTGGAGGGSTFMAQPGQIARVTGNSDGMQLEYLTPAPAGPGREAWLVGGGDDAAVVYRR
jgi:phospholipase/lecithinase/hemolysin